MPIKRFGFAALVVVGSALLVIAVWVGFLSGYLSASKETKHANELLSAPKNSSTSDEAPSNLLVEGIPTVGDYFAVIRIPALGNDWLHTVSEGTTPEILDDLGVGHYEGTELPGEPGNFALAGHSGSSWTPFAKLDDVAIGEYVELETFSRKYVYEVIDTETVEETDVKTVYDNPEFGKKTLDDQWLTITTCLTDGPQNLRYVVYAKLVSESAR